ncbi:MAG: ribosome maturation factor RimP [Deltaproteobacteria bacterium]|nr:ribosome maturation factor RimP [Deltaproteobacteria bacterium]
MDRTLAQKLWEMLDPVVAHQGYEIVEVEVHGSRNVIVRVFIDGPSGITIDKCAEFSRLFSDLLDVEDPIKARYTLEVSSPGLDRPLRKPAHFKKAVGQQVQLKYGPPGDKLTKLRGALVAADEASIEILDQMGSKHSVNIADVFAANVVYDVAAELRRA